MLSAMPSRRQSSAIGGLPAQAIEHDAVLLCGRVMLPLPDVAGDDAGMISVSVRSVSLR